jgi:uncharacterized Tic20 family protein
MQITLAIYAVALDGLLAVTFGSVLFALFLLVALAVVVTSLVFLIVAVVRSAQSRECDVPSWLCFRIIR